MAWTVFHLWQLARTDNRGPPTRSEFPRVLFYVTSNRIGYLEIGFGGYILFVGLWNIRLAYITMQGYAPPPSGFLGIVAMFPVTIIFEFFFPTPPVVSDQAALNASGKKTN